MSLSVGIDVSAIPPDPRGAGRYVIELVRALNRRGAIELRLETRRSDRERWAAIAPSTSIAGVVPDGRARRLAWEQLVGPRFADGWGVDVLHCPHYTMPEIAKVAKVVTVHDLTFFDHPEWHERVKVSVFKRAIRHAAARADALICVSEATARRLRELLAPACPVHVVPHGIDHDLFRPAGPGDKDRARLDDLGIHGRYVAFVGTLEPRKDLATLVAAFDHLAAEHPDLDLVIAGGRGWRNERYERAVATSPHRSRILETGYLPDESIAAVLRGAVAAVYPALEEGFGLPAVEALACGTPLVTTEGSVMAELAGHAAVTVPAASAGALAAAIHDIAAGEPGVEQRRTAGLALAATYTWDATAAGHEAVYRDVAARHPRPG